MEEALVNHLLAQAGLSALVADRITWAVRPQGSELPAIVLAKIDTLPDYHMAGPSGLASSRIQVDCWGSSYAAAKGVARQVEAALSGIDESISDGNSPEAFTLLRGGFMQGELDTFELGQGQEKLYRTILDFIIWTGQG